MYSSVSHFSAEGVPITDKLFFDLDSDIKEAAFPETKEEDEKVMIMREDPDRAEEVLGGVLKEAQKIAEYSLEREWPMISVFSGFGIHVHLLIQPLIDGSLELKTNSRKIMDELDLSLIDVQCVGDTSRLMRIPNCHRVWGDRICGLYTIPISPEKLLELDAHDLIMLSEAPHEPNISHFDRPEIEVVDEYVTKTAEVNNQTADINWDKIEGKEGLKEYIKDVIKMPCMWQALLQDSPRHRVRFNSAIHLFNCGMTPDDVFVLFESLHWSDWKPELTRNYLKQIYNRGYADMSCQTLQEHGHCVFELDERQDKCPTYGWKGGKQRY